MNSIPLADQTISRSTSSLPRRSRHLHSEAPCTSVCPLLSPLLMDSSEFHDIDSITIPYVNNDPDWVNASISIPTPVFQISPSVADCNPIDN